MCKFFLIFHLAIFFVFCGAQPYEISGKFNFGPSAIPARKLLSYFNDKTFFLPIGMAPFSKEGL